MLVVVAGKTFCEEGLKEAPWEVNRQWGCVPSFQADKANAVGRWERVGRRDLADVASAAQGRCTHRHLAGCQSLHCLVSCNAAAAFYRHQRLHFKEYFQCFVFSCVDPSSAQSTTEASDKAESVSTAGLSKHILCL